MRFILAFLLFAFSVRAENPLTLSFVSENQHLVPGKIFSVALFQQIEKGYHSYWRNPGTVGMGMSVQWKLPRGFQAGAIQWPTPEIGKMAVYDIWGYHNEAFLVVDITAPDDLKPGTKVTIEGTAVWMCCGKSCFPGNQPISLTLPVAKKTTTNPQWTERFAATRADQPVKSTAWRLKSDFTKGKYLLNVSPADGKGKIPQNVRFFDYDRQVSSEKGQRVKARRNRTTVVMHAEEHTGEEHPRLRGILVSDNEWQPGVKVIAVDVPVTRK
ncbi:MAG: protein-disulfide reductase DsbD domain-containing protein [Limisphaerales bacterium]